MLWNIKLLVCVVVGVISGVGVLANALWGPRAQMRKRLRNGALEIVDHAIVSLVGVVRAPASPLVAPLTGRACVVYHTSCRLYEGSGRGRSMVATFFELEMVPFELELDGRTVTVDGVTADLEIAPRTPVPRSLERDDAFLSRHGRSRHYLRNAGFEEASVAPGDRICVQGMALVEAATPDGETGYRDAPPRIRLVAHADHPLTIGAAR